MARLRNITNGIWPLFAAVSRFFGLLPGHQA